jgi:hypothetical protein
VDVARNKGRDDTLKNFDLAPDGKRIVALIPAAEATGRKRLRTTSSSS